MKLVDASSICWTAEVDTECDQLLQIGNIAHGFDCANSHVDFVQEFG